MSDKLLVAFYRFERVEQAKNYEKYTSFGSFRNGQFYARRCDCILKVLVIFY